MAQQRSRPGTTYANLGAKKNVSVSTGGKAIPLQQIPRIAPAKIDDRLARLERTALESDRNFVSGLTEIKASPIALGNHMRGLTLAAGATLLLAHRLNRAFAGWFVTACTGVQRGSLNDGTLPTGATSDKLVPIVNNGGATAKFDVWVF